MFVFVTKNGRVYNRTLGKNEALQYDTPYKIGLGNVIFTREDGKVFVTRMNASNITSFKKDITTSSMYVISALFVQKLASTPKQAKALYNRLKTTIGTPKFTIRVKESMRMNYKIKLKTWMDDGFNYKFVINVKDADMKFTIINEIYSIIDRVSKLDLPVVLKHFGALESNELMVDVNGEFLQLASEIERVMKRKQLVAQ